MEVDPDTEAMAESERQQARQEAGHGEDSESDESVVEVA